MNPYLVLCFLIAVIHLCVGTSVFLKAPRHRTNQVFYLAIIALALWILANTASATYWQHLDRKLILSRLAYATGMLTTGAVASFCIVFSNKKRLPRKSLALIAVTCGFFLTLVFLPGAILKGFRMDGANIVEVHGPFRNAFYIAEAVIFFYGLWHLWRRYKETPHGEERFQLKLLGAGIFIPALISLFALGILSHYVTGSDFISSIGPISTVFFIVLAGHAISRQGLFVEVDLATEYVFNSIAAGICVTQVDRRIIKHNPRLVEILEYEGELTGRSIDDLIIFLESNNAEGAPNLRRWFETRQPQSLQITLSGSGSRTLELAASPLTSNKGKPVGNVFLFHDITERKRLEEELERTRVKFTEKRARGWINVGATRMCLMDIAGGWRNLYERLLLFAGNDTTRRVIFEAGCAETFSKDALRTGFLAPDAQGFRDAVDTFAEAGFGDFRIAELDWENGYALITCKDTFEGWSFRGNGQAANEVVCNYSRGVLLSFMQNTSQIEGLECAEKECIGRGDDRCEFVIASKARLSAMGIKVPPYGKSIKEKAEHLKNLLEEKERLEEAIRSSEEKYRLLVENANDIIYMTDSGGNFTFLNRVAEKITGYGIEEWIGKNFRELMVPGEEEKVLKHAREVYKGKPQRYESKIYHKDGKILTLWNFLSPIVRDGEVVGFSVISRDITDTKELEQQLKESEKKYRTLVEESEDIVYIIQDGHLKFLNKTGIERSGYSEDKLFSEDFDLLRLFHPDDRALVAEALIGLSKENSVSRKIEARVVSKQGDAIDFILTGTSLTYQGKPAIMGMLVDITEKKKLQEQLVQSEKLASIGQMVSGVAHELNNPLAAIMGYAQLLSITESLPGKERAIAGKIFESSERCKRIIQNLLSFARKQELRRVSVNLNDVLDKAIEMREYYLKAHNIEVYRDYQDDVKTTLGDSQQLQSVFLNLLNNACDAMYAENKKGVFRISTRIEGERIVVEFLDDGPGIPLELRDKVFDPFFTTKEVGKGTGLGLSISYGIIQEHGGELFLDKSCDRGTRFIISLPVVQNVQEHRTTDDFAPVEANHNSKRRILVVDDESTILDLSVDILTGEGYEVDIACTGTDAREMIESDSYDLVVADIRMPGMLSGIDLFNWAKQTMPGMEDRIIFMTGDMVADETQEFLTETKRPCLPKPFEISEYLKVIRDTLTVATEKTF